MNLLFVTGCNTGFFNTLLICLQSFSLRTSGQRLFVCDYGMTKPQAEFLREIGILIERPPSIDPSLDVFNCKAALIRYLNHAGHAIDRYDAIVWVDADLTFMDVGLGNFQGVAAEMKRAGAEVAVCSEPSGKSVGQMIAGLSKPPAKYPFAGVAQDAAIDLARPYVSTGLFWVNSASFLTRWNHLTLAVEPHTLFEQNMFNVVLHRSLAPFLLMDCETWQAQGSSLDRVRLRATGTGGLGAVIANKNIKTLHATSPLFGHVQAVRGCLTVDQYELNGIFKLILKDDVRSHQLELLASFVYAHARMLTKIGVCRPAACPCEGFQFVITGPADVVSSYLNVGTA